MKSNLHVLLNALLCISLATAGSGAQAEMLKPDSGASTERDRVIAALQRPEIRARLAAQGVDAGEAEARVALLTDEEAAVLGSRFEELPAGGDPRGFFALLVVVGVVYVVIKLLPLILIGGGTVAAIKAGNRNG
jgi:hypothetical protein